MVQSQNNTLGQMEEKKQVWSTADIIKNRTNWTLASDVELLKHLQSLSEKLVSKSRATLQLLNSFEDDVNSTCTSIANVNNRFEALSDTQFIENKVRDDSPETEKPPVEVQQEDAESSENITEKLNEALSNGIQVLRTQYDIIAVTDSESEDDEPQEVLLKARNPFMSRRLPYVIGSEEFNKHDHLGLVTSSEDEDDENNSEGDEEDDEEDDLGYLNKVVPLSESATSGIKSRTQVIQVSSDSEDSDISSLRSEKDEEKVAQNNAHTRSVKDTPKTTHTFAEHLNATLRNMDGNVITPLVDDVFSPPPFPTNEDDQSDDEKSDDGSDIFATRIKVAERSSKANIVSDIFDDEVPGNIESSRISRKSEATIDNSQSKGDSLTTSKLAHSAANSEPDIPPKPYVNVSTSKMFSAVNAELSSRLNKNVVAKDECVSSDENDSIFSKSSSSSNNRKKNIPVRKQEKPDGSRKVSTSSREESTPSVPTPNSCAEDALKNTSSKPVFEKSGDPFKSQVDDDFGSNSSNSLRSPVVSKPNTSKVKTKVVSLFDDDDSMDELFNSNSKDRKKTSPSTTISDSRKVLFDEPNDLFSPTKELEKLATKSTTSSAASLLNKKIALFEDDSDSGDDIFAIINSQKKKSMSSVTKMDVERRPEDNSSRKMFSVGSEENLFASNESKITSNSSVKNDIFEAKKMAEEKSVHKNRINGSTNLFDTDNENDDLFSIVSKDQAALPSAEREKVSASQINKKSIECEQYESKSETLFESVLSKKGSSLELKKESSDQDVLQKVPSRPSAFSQSSFLENSNEKISNSSLFDTHRSEPSISEVTFSKSTNESSVVSQSKFIEKNEDDLFASSTLENQATSDSTESVRSGSKAVNTLSRQFEETSAPLVPTRIFDETDGSINVNQTSTRPPAKLAISRGLNINVNALLPGSSWSSISKQVKENVAETDKEEFVAPSSPTETQPVGVVESLKTSEKAPDLLKTIAKERTKLAGRRRPPSRRARVNKALQSDLFASNATADSTDDEPDSAYKTASESNSPEKNSLVTKNRMKNLEERRDSIPSLEETQFVPPTSAMTNYQKERSKLAKQAKKKRPPSMLKEKTTNDLLGDDSENKNKIANDLGNILITASSSREPPAMIENDFKSALSDSDKDDDPLEDIMAEIGNINDPIPQIDAENSNLFSSSMLSPPVAAPRTSTINKSTLFDSLEDDNSNDLFAKLKSPDSSPSSTSGFAKNTEIVISRSIIDQPSEPPVVVEKPVALENYALPSNTQLINDSKVDTSSSIATKLASDLFSSNEDDSDDDLEALFSKVVSPKMSVTKSDEISSVLSASNEATLDLKKESSTSNASPQDVSERETSKKSDLFTEDDSIPSVETSVKSHTTHNKVSPLLTHSNEEAKKSSKTMKISTNLFADDDDDDELFSSNRGSSVRTKISTSKSLFADDDEDDDNSLFGSVAPSRRGAKSIEISKSTNLTAPAAEKARIVKLRSQTVEKDPLTGKIIEK